MERGDRGLLLQCLQHTHLHLDLHPKWQSLISVSYMSTFFSFKSSSGWPWCWVLSAYFSEILKTISFYFVNIVLSNVNEVYLHPALITPKVVVSMFRNQTDLKNVNLHWIWNLMAAYYWLRIGWFWEISLVVTKKIKKTLHIVPRENLISV